MSAHVYAPVDAIAQEQLQNLDAATAYVIGADRVRRPIPGYRYTQEVLVELDLEIDDELPAYSVEGFIVFGALEDADDHEVAVQAALEKTLEDHAEVLEALAEHDSNPEPEPKPKRKPKAKPEPTPEPAPEPDPEPEAEPEADAVIAVDAVTAEAGEDL